jgi:hypothetical protein
MDGIALVARRLPSWDFGPRPGSCRERPRRVTTSWSIPNSPPDGPQVDPCGPFVFRPVINIVIPAEVSIPGRNGRPVEGPFSATCVYIRVAMLASAVLVALLVVRTDSRATARASDLFVAQPGGLSNSKKWRNLTYDPAMGTVDPEQERKRLAEFYSRQTDGELEKVASEASELTSLAHGTLRAEMSRRGLSVEPLDRFPEPQQPEFRPAKLPSAELPAWLDTKLPLRELVTLRKFRDLPEAVIAKGCLESAGIESCLVDDNMVRMDWFWSNLLGGIKLQVREEDALAAASILDQPIPEVFDVAGVGAYQQPRCPKCDSLDVTYKELDRPIAYVSAYFNVPIPVRRRAWRCRSCRSQWEDTGPDNDRAEPI